jgi:hypothetical protein
VGAELHLEVKGSLDPSGRGPKGRKELVFLVRTSSSCPYFCMHVWVWTSRSCSPRQEGMACHGGTMPIVEALWDCGGTVRMVVVHQPSCRTWVHCSRRRLCPGACFFGNKLWSVYTGSSCPTWATYSLGRSPLAPTSCGRVEGIIFGRFMGNWPPGHVHHSIVGTIIHPIRLDGIWIVPSYVG